MLRLTPVYVVTVGLLASSAASCTEAPIDPEQACHAALTDPYLSGPMPDHCAIFASASLGDDAHPGSKALPVKTLTRALQLAGSGERPPRVYACTEPFFEAVEVPAGMTVRGGFDCSAGWALAPLSVYSELFGGPGQIALIVQSDDEQPSTRVTRIKRFHVGAPNAQAPGDSSIAVLVQPNIAAVFDYCGITAGHGADGVVGADGAPFGVPVKAGTKGNNGADACTANLVPGALLVESQCGEPDSYGGAGGDGMAAMGSAGAGGQPAPVPNTANSGLGGSGQDATALCTDGKYGAPGIDGQDGQGARAPARIGLAGYVGSWGNDGTPGTPGQGGGGGGGARAGVLFCGAGPSGGASGGSGGGGGCGGQPGRGGGPGGASIGVIDLSGRLSLWDTFIQTGNGGNGGSGGWFQLGGLPAIGGAGGMGYNGSQAGCAGGYGGPGGDGGIGGGGLGGASIGLAYLVAGDSHVISAESRTTVGYPGRGGGILGRPSTLGGDGETGKIVQMLPAD